MENVHQQSPVYKEIVNNCRNEGATVIDFGCCLGQDVRQLVYDGVPVEQIRGYELDPFFIEQGYELFRDGKIMNEKKIFSAGDIFDDEFLARIEPADYLYAGSFIHLFNAETQNEVCRRLSRLCKRAIAGRQMGALIAEERTGSSRPTRNKRMVHSPESFARMWEKVTDGHWQAESAFLQARDGLEHTHQLLTFVIRKQTEQ